MYIFKPIFNLIILCFVGGSLSNEIIDFEKKTYVSPTTFFGLQQDIGIDKTHAEYTIFKKELIPVPLYSKNQGTITIYIHPQFFIPILKDSNGDGTIEFDEIKFFPTKHIVDHIRLALNGSNSINEESVVNSIRLLAKDSQRLTKSFLDSTDHDELIFERYGIELFDISNKTVISPGKDMIRILNAMRAELKR